MLNYRDAWLEHKDPDCIGIWHYHERAKAFICPKCKRLHPIRASVVAAYRRWQRVDAWLREEAWS